MAARLLFKRLLAAAAIVAASPPARAADNPDLLSPPTERGKPHLTVPPAVPPPESPRCLPALPCGTQLYGAVERNGAVELRVPALKW